MRAGTLDEMTNDHGGARGNRRAAVGHDGGVGLGYDYVVVADVEGFCGNLREDGVGALAEFRIGYKDSYFALGDYIDTGK